MSTPAESSEESSKKTEIVKIEQEVSKQFPNFRKLPAQERKRLVEFFVIQKSHIGPLPDPDTLREYNDIIKNGAERCMVMAEKEQSNRWSMNDLLVKGKLAIAKRGQIFALGIVLVALSIAAYMAYLGQFWPSTVFGVGGLATITVAFLSPASRQ